MKLAGDYKFESNVDGSVGPRCSIPAVLGGRIAGLREASELSTNRIYRRDED